MIAVWDLYWFAILFMVLLTIIVSIITIFLPKTKREKVRRWLGEKFLGL